MKKEKKELRNSPLPEGRGFLAKEKVKIPQNFRIKENKLVIPKLKSGIEIVFDDRIFPEKQMCLFITKTAADTYHAVFQCEVEIDHLPKSDKTIGFDLGIKSLLKTSDNENIENPKFYRKLEKKLAYEQKKLSKKKKGSNNRDKQRRKLAEINEYIANCRRDYIHKITTKLINENQVIIAEDLLVKNMIKNHKLAKSIQDASWGEIYRQLDYKARWYGRTFYKIDRFFPSSKTCNGCQFVVDNLPLNIREWDCPNCHQHNDRDLNAALNIRDKGIKDLEFSTLNMSGCGVQSDKKQKLVEASVKKLSRRNKKSLDII